MVWAATPRRVALVPWKCRGPTQVSANWQSKRKGARKGLRGSWLTALVALSVAACAPNGPGHFALGTDLGAGPRNTGGAFQLLPDPKGGGETFFTLSLPPEPALPKGLVTVSGTPGAMNSLMSANFNPTITAIMPEENGFTLEGAKLDKATLKVFLGSAELTITERKPGFLVAKLPKNAQTSGVLVVRDGNAQILRASADARSIYVGGRVVVRFLEGAPRASVERALQNAGMTAYRFLGVSHLVAHYPADQAFNVVQNRLMAQGSVVELVSRDTLYKGQGLGLNDPLLAQQWALDKINASAGWASTMGLGVTVGVLDTGVAGGHQDLSPNMWVNSAEVAGNGIDDDGNGRIDDHRGWNTYAQTNQTTDDHGHGTQVAGLIAAAGNDGFGVAGMVPQAKILPVKVLNARNVGTTSSLIDGVNYAVRSGAQVIVTSVGSLVDDTALKDALEYAVGLNVTVVAAMGNDGANVREYPAAWSRQLGIIAVGATNQPDVRPNWGTWGDWMTVCAPSEDLLTTTLGNGHTRVSGTSFGAAYTAGLAAMLKASRPSYTPAQIREVIITTAVDRGTPGYDPYYGWGRIMVAGNYAEVIGSVLVSSSSEHFTGNFPAGKASDKNTETYWSSARRQTDNPEWLAIDLGKSVTLNSMALMAAPFYSFLFPADFRLELSNDGVSWTAVASEVDYQLAESTWGRWNFAPTRARFARIYITRSRVNPDNSLFYSQISEVAFNGEENGIPPTSSSNFYGVNFPSTNAYDGDPTTFWVSGPKPRVRTEFILVDLLTAQRITSVSLQAPPDSVAPAFPKKVALYGSNDKINWAFMTEQAIPPTPANGWWKTAVPVPQVARYLRVEATDTNYVSGTRPLYASYGLRGFTAGISEVEINRP